jgi:hypothetical protein
VTSNHAVTVQQRVAESYLPATFSASASPLNRTVVGGSASTATYTIGTATSGTPQIISAFAVSGLPSGVSGTFNPAGGIVAGQSATLTLTIQPEAQSSRTRFTVSATGCETKMATATLTIEPPWEPPPDDGGGDDGGGGGICDFKPWMCP